MVCVDTACHSDEVRRDQLNFGGFPWNICMEEPLCARVAQPWSISALIVTPRFTGRSLPTAARRSHVSFAFSHAAVKISRSSCQRSNRLQQISASFRATAIRAILALNRFRMRA